jgi:hypothetical protein
VLTWVHLNAFSSLHLDSLLVLDERRHCKLYLPRIWVHSVSHSTLELRCEDMTKLAGDSLVLSGPLKDFLGKTRAMFSLRLIVPHDKDPSEYSTQSPGVTSFLACLVANIPCWTSDLFPPALHDGHFLCFSWSLMCIYPLILCRITEGSPFKTAVFFLCRSLCASCGL